MISIRLSSQEYRELKSRCIECGDFNVSEFVRAATMHALSSPELSNPPTYLELKVASLFSRLERLEQRVIAMAAHGSGYSEANGSLESSVES
jgi:hypothetical protein